MIDDDTPTPQGLYKCSRCQKKKGPSYFAKNACNIWRDGLAYQCRECYREYNESRKAEARLRRIERAKLRPEPRKWWEPKPRYDDCELDGLPSYYYDTPDYSKDARYADRQRMFWGDDCAYCGTPLLGAGSWEAAHPLTKRGDQLPGNVYRICAACVKAKKDQILYHEWQPPDEPRFREHLTNELQFRRWVAALVDRAFRAWHAAGRPEG